MPAVSHAFKQNFNTYKENIYIVNNNFATNLQDNLKIKKVIEKINYISSIFSVSIKSHFDTSTKVSFK